MASVTETSTAIFDCCPDKESFSSTSDTPRFYRSNWDGVELPRRPSLKLEDDEFFFQLISSSDPNDSGENHGRCFDFVPRPLSRANRVLVEQEDEMSTKKHVPVPLHIRKLEIELVQRKLPRYPSQTHLFEASFYPSTTDDDLLVRPESIISKGSISSWVSDGDDDDTFATETEIIFTEDEDEILFENYDSEEIEEGVDPGNMNEEDLNRVQTMHSENSEYTDPDYNIDDDIDDNIDDTIYEIASDFYNELSFCSVIPSPPIVPEEKPYEIGVIPPSLQAMIFQAQIELRCRKVPEEHIKQFKTSLADASEIGRATKLNEVTVEAYGRQCEKKKPLELPSDTWVKGEESVSLPNFNDQNPTQFTVFNEAVALGGIKALKPKITTNYNRLLSNESTHGEDVDVDDTNMHKQIRTKYLTDIYLQQDYGGRSNDEDDELEHINYESLDDVKLPTSQCPVRKPVATKMTNLELKNAISQQVAEKVWERRYRLERPRAEPRIIHCKCKYCPTASPYQTFAYRKKWLVQQDLWKEPPVEEDPIIAENLDSISDDPIIAENLDSISEDHLTNRTLTMSEKEVDRGNLKMDLESKDDEMSGDMTINTENIAITNSRSGTAQSDSGSAFAVEESEMTKNNMSMILEKDEERIESNMPTVETNVISSPSVSPSVIPARPTSKDKIKPEVKRKKTFMFEVQSLLGLSEHSTGSRTRRLHKENDRKKRLEQGQKAPNKNKRMIRSGINSMRSLFGSSHHRRTTPE